MTVKRLARWLSWVGLGLLVSIALIGWTLAFSYHGDLTALAKAAAKRSPVTDYYVASKSNADCLSSYDAKFKADIADLANAATGDAGARDRAHAELADDQAANRQLAKLCPPPIAPTFDDAGNQLTPLQTFPQTFAPSSPPPP